MTTLEVAAFLEVIINGMDLIVEAPQDKLVSAGVEDLVIDVWNELQDIRREVRSIFLQKFFAVT